MLTEFKSINDLIAAFPTEKDCINHLEKLRWNGIPVSPFEEGSKVYKCSGNRYKCKNTGKYFNVKVGTVFEDTKIPLIKWFTALYVFSSHKKGISSHQLAKDIDVTQKTAWFLLHRLRYSFGHPAYKTATLNNTVEIDETFVGGKEKNKHEHKKAKPASAFEERPTHFETKMTVVGAIERNGQVRAQHIQNRNKENILPFVAQNIGLGAMVMTDEWYAYNELPKIFRHHTINHSMRQYVDGSVHTNTIENFWSHMKRGIVGIYHQISKKHAQSYIDEYVIRFNSRKTTTSNRFNMILENVDGRLTYKALIK